MVQILLLAVFLLIAIDRKLARPKREGFTLSKKYVEKNGNEVFDDFYVTMYDSLYNSTAKDNFELLTIEENTNLGKSSKILDVGSGTGNLVGYYNKNGYNIIGIDTSSAMIEKSKEKFPEADFRKANVLKQLLFNQNIFAYYLYVFTIWLY